MSPKGPAKLVIAEHLPFYQHSLLRILFAKANLRQRFMWANELTLANILLWPFSGMKR